MNLKLKPNVAVCEKYILILYSKFSRKFTMGRILEDYGAIARMNALGKAWYFDLTYCGVPLFGVLAAARTAKSPLCRAILGTISRVTSNKGYLASRAMQ